MALLHAFYALARKPVLGVHLDQQILVELQFILDHLGLEGRWHRNESKRRMGDDDGIPVGGRCPRQEPMALFPNEVGLVRDQDAGVGI